MNKAKTIIKQGVLTALMAVTIVSGIPMVQAQGSAYFNTNAQDRPTLRVSNYTQNPGCSSCWTSSVSASAGEVVSFNVYYHNDSNITAQNTRIRLNLPGGVSGSHTITADIWADNAPVKTGQVTVSLNSAQSLTLIPDSVKWYPNRGTAIQSFPNGQSGQEITSGGVVIGNLAPGWSMQGEIVARVQVGSGYNPTPQGGAPSVTTNTATSVEKTLFTANGGVNPNGSQTTAWFEYGTTQNLGNTTNQQTVGSGNTGTQFSNSLTGLSPNTTYYFRAAAQNSYGTTRGAIMSATTQSDIYTPPYGGQGAPGVYTNSATNVGNTYATLSGSVNPNGYYTTAWFEWGTNTGYFDQRTDRQSVGSGGGYISVSNTANSLQVNTTYYYRIVGENSYGITRGNVMSFTTQGSPYYYNPSPSYQYYYPSYPSYQYYYPSYTSAPTVRTQNAQNIDQTSFTMWGAVNANGSYTTAWFEWGTSASLNNTTYRQTVGSGSSESTFTQSLLNLETNRTYYYRMVAQNTHGTAYGNIVSVTTSSYGYQYGTGYYGAGYGTAPQVQTLAATTIGSKSALARGSVTPYNVPTTVWFEWGTDPSLNMRNRTTDQFVSGDGSARTISAALINLEPEVTYYYRIVASNQFGLSTGSIMSFTTKSFTYTEPAPRPRPITTPTETTLVVLIPDIDNGEPQAGDTVVFTVSYDNPNTSALTDAVITIALPEEVTFVKATPRQTRKRGNEIIFNLGTIKGQSGDEIAITAKVKSDITEETDATFNAMMTYVDAKKRSQLVSTALDIVIQPSTSFFASLWEMIQALLGNWMFYVVLLILIIVWAMTTRRKRDEINLPPMPPAGGSLILK